MNYKTFVSMNIAVIGTGHHTENFATNYAVAGHEVFLAWKTNTTITTPAMDLFNNINVCSIEEAADMSDIIVITSAPKDVREIAYFLGDVRGKVIIDATANIYSSHDEPLNTTNAIKAITGSSYIVKVFCTRGYQHMLKPFLKKDDVQWLMVGDSKKAKEATKILARDMGVNSFMDLGGTESIPLFDAMTKCWREFANIQQPRAIEVNK